MKTLILALGNPLRADDGIGAAVLAALPPLPGVDVVDGGTAGLEAVLLMQGYDRVIVVDAAEMRVAPGEWRRFTTEEIRLQVRDMHLRGTMHYAALPESLALAEALGIMPPTIIVYGVQPSSIDWEIGLSAPVEAAVPALVAAIVDEVGVAVGG